MSRVSLLVPLVALFSLSLVSFSVAQSCGGEGYDVSSLVGQDYSITVNSTTGGTNYTYYVAPCSSITSIPPCAGSMFCQVPLSNTSSAFILATYNSSVSQEWVPMASGVGVEQIIMDGQFCGPTNNLRETSLVFLCNPAATTASLISVVEVETCHYTATFQTSQVCNVTASTGAPTVGTTFFSNQCGGGVYDLSSLASQQLSFTTNTSVPSAGYVYYLNTCGTVTQPNCTALGSSMFCQTTLAGSAWLLSNYNSSIQGMYTVDSNGLTMAIQDGTFCAAVNAFRETTLILSCDPSATSANITQVLEQQTCWYTAWISTSAVCSRMDGGTPPTGAQSGASTAASVSVVLIGALALLASMLG